MKIYWPAVFSLSLIMLIAGCKKRIETQTPSLLPEPPAAEEKAPSASYGKIPPYFIENRGQIDSTVKYYVKGPKGTVYFTAQEVVFDFLKEEKETEDESPGETGPEKDRHPSPDEKKTYTRLVYRYKFAGANAEPQLAGRKELPGKINYFIGSKDNWQANIPTYEEVIYRGIYDGINLKYLFREGKFKYTFTVGPGAKPDKILLSYEGIEGLEIKPSGDLVILTSFGGFVEKAPEIHQEISGKKVKVEGKFKLIDKTNVAFDISSYDTRHPLQIDPVLDLSPL